MPRRLAIKSNSAYVLMLFPRAGDPNNLCHFKKGLSLNAQKMSKVHFLIGHLSSETVSSDQAVVALLPETQRPMVVPTYSAQLHEGAQTLVHVSSAKNIFTAHFLPLIGAVDKNALAAKRRELDSTRVEIEKFSGDATKRASIFINYLTANKLIDRKLYPVVEKLKRDVTLSNKDLTPLVDAVYTSLRKGAGATSAHKDKIRVYLQNGEYDSALIDWFQRFVDPRFGMFQQAARLNNEVEESEKSNRVTADPALMRDFCAVVDELAEGQASDAEIQGVALQRWLEELVGCKVERHFFAPVRLVRNGVNNSGCLRLESLKGANELGEALPKLISLESFSRVVTAFDRALSALVTDYANADPEMKALYGDLPIHSGLLIRGLLGEPDAVRTLYPKNVVGMPGKPELDDVLIAKTREAFESGLLSQLCAKAYDLDEHALQACLERCVAIQKKLMPLLPAEIYNFIDVTETGSRLKKMLEKLEAAANQNINQAQQRALRISINAQNARGQQIAKRLKADFRADVGNLFSLDEPLVDEVVELFGSELSSLRPILTRYFKTEEEKEETAPSADGVAETASEETEAAKNAEVVS